MDSLLATYTSSDDDEEPKKPQPAAPRSSSSASRVSSLFSSIPPPKSSYKGEEPAKVKSSSLFSSIPPPKSSSLFNSLPQPKQSDKDPKFQTIHNDGEEVAKSSNPNSRFSALPQPKSSSTLSSSLPNPKKVVQFKPPINPTPKNFEEEDDDDEDDDEEEERRKRRESESLALGSSVTSFLSKIPAPRNSASLGAGSSLGSGRRSVIETQVSGTNSSAIRVENHESDVNYASVDQNPGNYESSIDQNAHNYADNTAYGNYEVDGNQNVGMYGDQASYGSYQSSTDPNVASSDATYYGGYESHGSYYGQQENSWADASTTMAPVNTGVSDAAFHIPKKRGRKDVPLEIIEVKQDELMKNRPREDTAKLTGLAFGPSYQPVSTSKGKPSKLHKRKHQIGTLYHDMRQKESELAERRAKGQLTKAETHAKYGW